MAEPEATEPVTEEALETPDPIVEPPAEPEPKDKRGRGRPAGSKDKAPRVVKPKIRVKVEPLAAPVEAPAPEPAAEPAASSSAAQPPAPEPTPEPSPPSPRTMYRQTAAQLLSLRDVMTASKRAATASQYSSKLHAWPII